LNSAERKAVERCAQGQAEAHFEGLGWEVHDVSASEPFDLRCRRSGEELHVECKGTIGLGQGVVLTRGEVVHVRNFPNAALYIVSSIHVDRSDSLHPVATGGKVKILEPWMIQDDQLIGTQFLYRLPIKD
jgi:Domain of unknown function (DUF3883)